jgi:hypothetical protein
MTMGCLLAHFTWTVPEGSGEAKFEVAECVQLPCWVLYGRTHVDMVVSGGVERDRTCGFEGFWWSCKVVRRTGPMDRRRQTGLLIQPHFTLGKTSQHAIIDLWAILQLRLSCVTTYSICDVAGDLITTVTSLDLSHIDTTRSTFHVCHLCRAMVCFTKDQRNHRRDTLLKWLR